MISVAVMGLGVVGSGVMKMLAQNQDRISRAAGQLVRLSHGLDIREVEVPHGAVFTGNFEDILTADIAVETIGGVGVAYKFTKALLEAGKSVITSNKELVSEHGDELMAIARQHGGCYLFEASVGGGVPVLRPLRTCLAGNRITRIEGIVNGSTNYLLTRMDEQGLSFPAALSEAKQLGYAEENPAADIEGWDARRKLQILAAVAFGAPMSGSGQIPTEGIARITERDLMCARALGMGMKLIAHAELGEDSWSGWVNPALVSAAHPLSRVRDVFNGIVVSGDFVDQVLFQGRGAGSLPTASAIVGDIIEAARGTVLTPEGGRLAFASPEHQQAQLMVRVEAGDFAAARRAITAVMPDARITEISDMLCLVTPRRPYAALVSALGKMDAGVLRLGIPVRIL